MVFAIFDIETRIDKKLLNQVFFAAEALTEEDAYRRYVKDLHAQGSDFLPLSLHVPISISIGQVDDDHVLRAVDSLALEDYSEDKLVRAFWSRTEGLSACLVSFNGRGFDLPVLELAALRYGISAPGYFDAVDSPRSRHFLERHFDLYEYLTNYGASRLSGGLDLLLKMLGLPGKQEINGAMVQEYFDAGRLDEIHRYCRSDVIQTYFLFLRVQLMRGRISEATYRAAMAASRNFLDQLREGRRMPGAEL
jgi:3'-5' exonuclease